ncbi:MAG TPA: SRPBCC family protein [Candidatus Acidoferrum sp.]|nr:SRPBCC family protein [Candidatus Acidoferrum sp.]
MRASSPDRRSTQVSRIIKAPRQAVYEACVDPDAVVSWRVPDNMTGHVHAFDAREGGIYRMSLTYQDSNDSPGGKTSDDTDTFQGRFLELIPYEKIVEVVEFESPDPRFAGEMTITTCLSDTDDGTEITLVCVDIPSGIRLEDNELGSKQSLRKLAALLE